MNQTENVQAIDSTSPKYLSNPIVTMETPFTDERGRIQPLVDETMNSAVLIFSKKGAVRANHWHKTDWHYCYVTYGEIEYHWRACGETGETQKKIIKAGENFFTPPMVEHTMVFTEDTEFICLGKNSRSQEVYEADIEKVELVKPTPLN